jgi:hypothetical protein
MQSWSLQPLACSVQVKYNKEVGRLSERPKESDCKSDAIRYAGSNPAPATWIENNTN